jgi:uncharacterized protein
VNGSGLNCTVVFALPDLQLEWAVQLGPQANAGDALRAARAIGTQRAVQAIDWEQAPIGIFGQRCTRETPLREGDRVEIYRQLVADPKESRRSRARRVR